jgi:hypothetical protein
MAHAGGRPTKYKKEYCETILEYFDIPATKVTNKTVITKIGVSSYPVETANPLPTIEGFARKIGVETATIVNWTKDHPEFLSAYNKAKSCSKEILNQNALMGRYSEGYAKFVAINCTDMRDKQEVEHSGGLNIIFEDPFGRAKD